MLFEAYLFAYKRVFTVFAHASVRKKSHAIENEKIINIFRKAKSIHDRIPLFIPCKWSLRSFLGRKVGVVSRLQGASFLRFKISLNNIFGHKIRKKTRFSQFSLAFSYFCTFLNLSFKVLLFLKIHSGLIPSRSFTSAFKTAYQKINQVLIWNYSKFPTASKALYSRLDFAYYIVVGSKGICSVMEICYKRNEFARYNKQQVAQIWVCYKRNYVITDMLYADIVQLGQVGGRGFFLRS